MRTRFVFLMLFPALAPCLHADENDVRDHYTKREVRIPMRDGKKLFTAIYTPKDQSGKHPILLTRTPYSVRPYGKDKFKNSLGPSRLFQESGYIFVYQDVRGRMMSEGTFVNMRPHVSDKSKPKEHLDESTDTYDTIAWLIKNVSNHNGRVGLWGISYPGFYSAAGMIDAHPALKAVSPQAPIADWFFDDFHHHGAFFLPHCFNFIARFGQPRPEPTMSFPPKFEHGTTDGYKFFLEMGPLSNANKKHFHNRIEFWNDAMEHPNYDEYWQQRNLLPHLKNVAPAVLTVGGWFDAEDLYGPLKIYRSIEEKNPKVFNALVMGPWSHGAWNRGSGEQLGNVHFGAKTSEHYRAKIEFPFFEHYLKDKGPHKLAEATMFETGTNQWRSFDHWPPKKTVTRRLWFHDNGKLGFTAPTNEKNAFDEYASDPARPVPFTEEINVGMTRAYMTDDQRFASRRPDVLVYQTDILKSDLTLAGPLLADLWVSTTGSDSDWIVKLIDVFPDDAKEDSHIEKRLKRAGYQMMVRSEVIRGRFRNSYEKPEPFIPKTVTRVKLELQDVLHTFQKGHRVMIQVQSSWFPLVDRNPQKFIPNIFQAKEADFIKTTQRVYRSKGHPSAIQIGVLGSLRSK